MNKIKKQHNYNWVGTMRTDPEFISELARKLGKSVEETRNVINIFVDTIREITNRNVSLPIRKLGVFNIRIRKNSVFTNCVGGLQETLPLIKLVVFKAAKGWRAEVNTKVREQLHSKILRNRQKTEDIIKMDEMEE